MEQKMKEARGKVDIQHPWNKGSFKDCPGKKQNKENLYTLFSD